MNQTFALSYIQSEQLLAAREKGLARLQVSLDLGLNLSWVELTAQGVLLEDGSQLAWEQIEIIHQDETCCYRVGQGQASPIRLFSPISGKVFSLMPTRGAPTLLISGIPMHRFKDVDPHQDTLAKIKAAAPIYGKVLDTATGLGYTAIQAARTASEVITIELEKEVLEIARQNPWSKALFTEPKIHQIIGDAFEEMENFADGEFRLIIHDPPAFSLAGELYSAEFYRQAYRVLNSSGRMFHYIGDPQSKMGAGVQRGVIRRLQQAGFSRILRKPQAFGLLAIK
ncbi:MAG: class I SAM-dependent methyltransferase [Chloroflexota bacterium]